MSGEAPIIDEMLVIPQEKSSLDNLEVIRVEAAGEVFEENGGDIYELISTKELEDLFKLSETGRADAIRKI